jgi:hypothetical protein
LKKAYKHDDGAFSLLQTDEGKKGVAAAMADPLSYVLKPQREGGGNNVYGDDIPPTLQRIMASTERDAYILMDRIRPFKVPGYILRPGGGGRPSLGEVIGELGIFGFIMGNGDEVFANEQVGGSSFFHVLPIIKICVNVL